jgi:hypothetical protein
MRVRQGRFFGGGFSVLGPALARNPTSDARLCEVRPDIETSNSGAMPSHLPTKTWPKAHLRDLQVVSCLEIHSKPFGGTKVLGRTQSGISRDRPCTMHDLGSRADLSRAEFSGYVIEIFEGVLPCPLGVGRNEVLSRRRGEGPGDAPALAIQTPCPLPGKS